MPLHDRGSNGHTPTVSTPRSGPVDISAVLAQWRGRSALHLSYWNDGADRALIRCLLGDGAGLEAAVERFATAQADSGATLPECCDHLAVLADVMGDSGARGWGLAPIVANVFFGDPSEWGLDPMTGCVTTACMHAVVHGLYRRAAALGRRPGSWGFLAVLLCRSGGLDEAVSREMHTSRLLTTTLAAAEAISQVRAAGFVALVDADHLATQADVVRGVLVQAGIAADVRSQTLPPGRAQARHLLDSMLTPRAVVRAAS